jgi:hypothetical protein
VRFFGEVFRGKFFAHSPCQHQRDWRKKNYKLKAAKLMGLNSTCLLSNKLAKRLAKEQKKKNPCENFS